MYFCSDNIFKRKMIIAVDGYSSCGKSTLAKDLAKVLNFTYIDSGAMYRAVTLYGLRKGIKEGNEQQIIAMLKDIAISFQKNKDGVQHIYLNNDEVSEEIRGMQVANNVSYYAKIKEVRAFLVAKQRDFAKTASIVMDGRDIGTVVFPKADLKIFMTADAQIRAQRRYDELQTNGKGVSMEEVLANIKERDFIDENREESPLRKAKDAFVIDNSQLTRTKQLDIVLEKIKEIQNSKYS